MKTLLRTTMLGCLALICLATPPVARAQTEAEQQMMQMQARLSDWGQLARYRADNAQLPQAGQGERRSPPEGGVRRVVFYGDSITDAWGRSPTSGPFFPGKPYLNRGIGGQTTPQMLLRFQQDVVHLKPALVVILAGTNDIAGNTGPATPEMIEDNFESMVAIAKANSIKVVIASILPASRYPWRPEIRPSELIRAMNGRLKAMCAREWLVYLDYYTPMANAEGGLDPDLAADGVHPTARGYAIMSPLAEQAIAQALAP